MLYATTGLGRFADDPQIRQPDITRAKQLLGWEPEVELEDGLRKMLPTLEQVSA